MLSQVQNPPSLSRKDSLVAFRVAAKDVGYLKKCAEDDYKRGEIKAPTLAALAKRLLYRHLRMLKDIDKARMMKYQQPRSFHSSTLDVEEPRPESDANDYPQAQDYDADDNDDDGLSIKRPYFYELFPDWKERIARKRHERSTPLLD
jgi:hypothetical protein